MEIYVIFTIEPPIKPLIDILALIVIFLQNEMAHVSIETCAILLHVL